MQTVRLQRLIKTAEKNLKKTTLEYSYPPTCIKPKTIGCVTPWDQVHHFVYPMLSDHFHNPFSFPRFTSDWFLPAPPRSLIATAGTALETLDWPHLCGSQCSSRSQVQPPSVPAGFESRKRASPNHQQITPGSLSIIFTLPYPIATIGT